MDIHFNRNKTANLQSKSQVFQILVNAGMDPADALDIAGLTNNVPDVILRMKALAAENAKKSIKPANPSISGDPNSVQDGTPAVGANADTASAG